MDNRHANTPESLYRYRSLKRGSTEVINSSLHFSDPSKFNDPFDGLFSIGGADDEIRKNLESAGIRGLLADSACGDLYAYCMEIQLRMREHIGICCFSEVPDNIQMWTHYADSHKGICIEYDLEKLANRGIRPIKIRYSDRMLVRPFENGGKPTSKDFIRAYLCKCKAFENEAEWRAILIDGESDVDVSGCIKSVSLGCRCYSKPDETGKDSNNVKEHADELIALVEHCKSAGIPVHDMEQDLTEYSLKQTNTYIIDDNGRTYDWLRYGQFRIDNADNPDDIIQSEGNLDIITNQDGSVHYHVSDIGPDDQRLNQS